MRVRVGARPPACARDGLTTRQARSSSRCRHRRGKSGGALVMEAGHAATMLLYLRRLPVAQLVGMRTSLEGPAAREGFRAFKEKCSPKWMPPDLHVDRRL